MGTVKVVRKLTTNQYARMMQMSDYQVRKWCREGTVKAEKKCKEWRIPVEVEVVQ